MKDIQEWLGHSSYNTTANIYAHLDTSSKNTSASKMSNVVIIEPVSYTHLDVYKRQPVMLILLPTLFILLCGSLVSCQASQEDSDLAAITQNKTSDSSVSDQDHENQEILNSVTYIDIDGVYFPISYVCLLYTSRCV